MCGEKDSDQRKPNGGQDGVRRRPKTLNRVNSTPITDTAKMNSTTLQNTVAGVHTQMLRYSGGDRKAGELDDGNGTEADL